MKEQFVPVAPQTSVVQALAHGACPICTLLRSLQNAIVETPHRYPATTLCNFHAWSLAHASPAKDAAPILRAMLERYSSGSDSDLTEVHPCDWCMALREQEDEKLAEYARELKSKRFRNWVAQFGTLCLFHGWKLMKLLTSEDAEVIRRVLASKHEELAKQLMEFEIRMKRGETGGGGVLGHVTEFLVSQRGLTR